MTTIVHKQWQDNLTISDEGAQWAMQISLTDWNKKKTITCILDTFMDHGCEDHNETFIYPKDNVPSHLWPYIEKISIILDSFDHLPQEKYKMIKELQKNFPIFATHNVLENSELDRYQKDLLQKQQQIFLTTKDIMQSIKKYDNAYDVLKKYEWAIKWWKKIHTYQAKMKQIQTLHAPADNRIIITLAQRYRDTQKLLYNTMMDSKNYDNHQETIELFTQIIESTQQTLDEYEKKIEQYYYTYSKQTQHPLSLHEYIQWYNGDFEWFEQNKILQKAQYARKKIPDKQDEITHILLDIENKLTTFQWLTSNRLTPWSEHIEYAHKYLQQKEERTAKERRWLSPKEQYYQRAWEDLRTTYLIARKKINEITDMIPYQYDLIDTIKNNIIITSDNHDHFQTLSANFKKIQGKLQFDNSDNLQTQYERALHQYKTYKRYMAVMTELMYQFSLASRANQKQADTQALQQLKQDHKFVFSLPKEIKNAGLRKFNSLYVDFAQWMRRKHKELDWVSPYAYLQNHGKRHVIVELISNLPPHHIWKS